MSRGKKFTLASLGCRTNQYEAQGFRTQLLKLGLTEAGQGEQADVCIVNTCSVTASAGRDSVARIRKLAKVHHEARLFVTGCHAQEVAEKVTDIPLQVVTNKEKENLLAHLFPEEELPEFAIDGFEAHTRAFVKVQDGCNSFCTYCIIPYVRGRSRSRTEEAIVREVEALAGNGFKEVVYTGINVGDYDGQGKSTLADLLKRTAEVEGIERIRVSSIDPEDVTDELKDVVTSGGKFCPSMHLVLQSGSNVTLKKMNRKYSRQQFLEVAEALKSNNPEFTLTTDVIVGFPGETEDDFLETLNVIKQVQFAKVHMFPYSPRERTRAALYPDHVPKKVVTERKNRLLALSQEGAHALREGYVGKTMEVLTEKGEMGHTGNFLPVKIVEKKVESNTLIKVKLIRNETDFLVGRPV